jgi:hypothetical protein
MVVIVAFMYRLIAKVGYAWIVAAVHFHKMSATVLINVLAILESGHYIIKGFLIGGYRVRFIIFRVVVTACGNLASGVIIAVVVSQVGSARSALGLNGLYEIADAFHKLVFSYKALNNNIFAFVLAVIFVPINRFGDRLIAAVSCLMAGFAIIVTFIGLFSGVGRAIIGNGVGNFHRLELCNAGFSGVAVG